MTLGYEDEVTRVRLATLTAAVLMVSAVAPALAHTGPYAEDPGPLEHENPGTHEVTPEYSYAGQIDIDEEVYVKSGWWSGLSVNPPTQERIRFGGGFGLHTSTDDPQNDTQPDEQQTIRWLYLTSGADATEDGDYVVEVTANGAVVAAMDVFKAYQGNGDMTPDCPQRIVEEILPQEDDDRIGYLFRVLHETTGVPQRDGGYHQRTAGTGAQQADANTMRVELDPDQASGDEGEPNGFVVAIYPQAASATEETNITFELSLGNDIGTSPDYLVKDNKNNKQPDLPFDRNDWAGDPDDVNDCRKRGLNLPPSLENESAQELPGTGPVEERLTTLLDSHLG